MKSCAIFGTIHLHHIIHLMSRKFVKGRANGALDDLAAPNEGSNALILPSRKKKVVEQVVEKPRKIGKAMMKKLQKLEHEKKMKIERLKAFQSLS